MGNIIINEISGNTLTDQASGVKIITYEDASSESDAILKELTDLKNNLSKEGPLYSAIEELQTAVEKKKPSDIKAAIKNHISEFSMSMFVNMASEALLNLIDSVK